MIPDYYRAKNVFGEMTFGEYWNLVGCHASAFRVKGHKQLIARCRVDGDCVRLFLGDGSFFSDGSEAHFVIPLDARAKVVGNRVTTMDSSHGTLVVDFFELKPLEFEG